MWVGLGWTGSKASKVNINRIMAVATDELTAIVGFKCSDYNVPTN